MTKGKTYYWQVYAKLNDNSFIYADGDLSAQWSFTTETGTSQSNIFDDNDSHWTYTGSWTASTVSGPYNNTVHYTNSFGASASIVFSGARFKLFFTKKPNRGSFQVWLDGATLVTTINAYSATTQWQQSYVSPLYTEGTHTLTILATTTSDKFVDIDAVQVVSVVAAGVYDDTNNNLIYTGTWTTSTGTGLYNNTMHFTTVTGSTAELAFYGAGFALTFTKNSNRGMIAISVDGNPAGTIDASSPTRVYQSTWTSPVYAVGPHILRLAYASNGTCIDIDAIQIVNIASTGTFDDTHKNWIYSGSWSTSTGTGPANGSLHYTSTVGASADLFFNGAGFVLIFTKNSNRGLIDVYVDGGLVDTIDASNPTRIYQTTWTWTSSPLTNSSHTLHLVHNGGHPGDIIDVDAIQIVSIVPAATYDDTNMNWVYSGSWTATTGTGPYNSTLHYTSTVGASADLLFTGAKFALRFTKNTNRGLINVYVDGNLEGTIDASNPTRVYQSTWTWTSPTFTNSPHILRLEHGGGDPGDIIDIDAVQVVNIVSPGIFDDVHKGWIYSGTWTASTATGPLNGTLHYTSTVDDYAELLFNGAGFNLIFTKNANRGLIAVYVDGGLVDTIDASNPTRVYQSTWTWTSAVNANDPHTVQLVHAGGDPGDVIDVDAIEIVSAH